MALLGSKLVTKEMQWNANMTEQNHLGMALMTKPHRFMGVMDTLFSSQNYYSNNPLSSTLLNGIGTIVINGSTEWEWELRGANTRPLVVVEDVDKDDPAPGKNRRTFRLKLDENWFLPGDILNPGTSNKSLQARVMTDPIRQGDGWIYEMRVVSDDDNLFIPKQYFEVGTQWAKLFSAYEEAAEQGGSTHFSTPIMLRNHMGKLRKQYKITDYASTEVLAVGIPDNTGKIHQSWIRYAEVEYFQQWNQEKERALWYSRDAQSVIGANGRPVRLFPGIQEQLEDSHIHYYSHLTAKLIEEYLMDIFYSRIKPGKGRNIKGYTGEYGMLMFHRAIQDWMNQSGFVKNVETFTKGVSSNLHSNALEAGYQFVRYNMANGSSLELVHNPLYDDREINFEIDPVTGYPLESQRITFLDFSGDNGRKSNIQKIQKADSSTFTYVCGSYGPFGPAKNSSMAAHSGDYYEMHIGETFGVHIGDVTKCGELILARN